MSSMASMLMARLPMVMAHHRLPITGPQAMVAASRLFSTGVSDQAGAGGSRQPFGFGMASAALLGVGAAATASGYFHSAADAPALIEVSADPYARPADAHALPSRIILYQYEVCPYCCKVRALLDYYKLPYSIIEVNPLTKGELKWSTYKKVPVVKLDDEVVVDSSAIISRLATDVAAARLATAAAPAPAPPAPAAPAAAEPAPAKRGGFFSFFGGSSSSVSDAGSGAKDQGVAAPAAAAAVAAPPAADALEEEVRWRKWVDDKLVKVLTANIYRNWDESVETFKYIADQTGWSWGAREVARWAGTVMMWQVGKRLPAKYGIEGDLRAALYNTANDFADNALQGKRFAGGELPNLADLSAFGVIRAVSQTGAFRDMMANSRLGPWFAAMEEAVGGSARVE